MRKIKNPWLHIEGYNCFGCAPENPFGLHMTFYEEGDDIISFWRPADYYQGWVGVLHGGIISTLIDETAGWVVIRKLQTAGLTARLKVAFKKSISSDEMQITIRARLKEQKMNVATIDVKVLNAHEEVCAEGDATYFLMSDEQSQEMGFVHCDVEGDNLLPF